MATVFGTRDCAAAIITLSSCSCSPEIRALKDVFIVKGDCRSFYSVDLLPSDKFLIILSIQTIVHPSECMSFISYPGGSNGTVAVRLITILLFGQCLLSCGILPVCIAFGDEGCIEH